ncbi:HNH endonuclease signature motif containing protein [Mycolicibacterium phocaicum]|uniref:HNH endonuclease n=1 Tax=Mycolicibacterium phocaicum TaxID=319706 RepID=A0A7I7ZLM4_9MYCO|nr:HNH endonuclease signature motif containing protein [Mycolicibacterium phocaicum]TLH70520.1 HNH endonuclease [Mycolicibacterium phocaicum]BBZ54662.1 HNH endonuclease [Mycolicibacterium phocaicum]
MATDRTTIRTAYAALADALAAVNSLDYTRLPIEVLLELQSQRETLKCAAEATDHQILAAAQTQATAKDIGAKDWPEVLHVRLRISREEARRRVRDTDNLGPRSAITGEPLGPVWELVAAALAEGAINSEHVQVITWFFQKLPLWAADPVTLAQCETDLVADARVKTPEDLRKVAADLLYRLDQDGPEPDDDEPDPKRSFVMGKQRPDGRTDVTAQLDPEGRAYWQVLFDKYAAPGMCNPADEVPCLSGTPTQEQIDADTRTLAQRQYDAFKMVGRMMLASSSGVHNGFPVGVVATCTVTDLEKRAGVAVTHTGTKLPVKDLVRMAAQGSDNYLAVFDDHTGQPLYLGRAARTASTAQRLALFARDLGCTRPNCTAPASRSQAHHVNTNWRDDGLTDITNLTLACGPDNRLVDTGGWTTTMGPDGRTHWTPPPLLDVGQPRTNQYHRPTLYPTERGDTGNDESDSPAR